MRLALPILVVLCALVLFSGLDRVGYVDVREARDAVVARELIRERDPLTPLLGHEPLFEKPVLAYVPEVVSALFSRDPATTSRMLRAFGAVLLLVLTASVGAEHFGARAGWFSGAVLLTTFLLPFASRTDGTQVFATLFGWVGCAGFADAIFGRRPGRGLRLVVAWMALATTLVVAGPLPALWPLLGVALYLGLAREREGWSLIRPLVGLVLMLGIALPWYGAMIERHGTDFLVHVPFFPHAQGRWAGFTGPIFAVTYLVLGFFPWSMLLSGAIQHAAARWLPVRARGPGARAAPSEALRSDPIVRETREEKVAHYFIACMLAALVPVAFYAGPPLAAALPAVPAAALLCGRFLDHLFENPARVAAPLWRAALMLALFGSATGIMLVVAATRLREVAPDLRLLGTVLFACSWAPFLACMMGRHRAAAALMLLPVALGTPVATMRLLPDMEGYVNTRRAGEAMADASPPRAPLVLLEPPPPSLRLYARRNLVVADTLSRAFEEYRAADGLTYVAFPPRREREVARAALGPLEILARTPSIVLARVHRGR